MAKKDSRKSETKPIGSLDELGVGTNLRFRLVEHGCSEAPKSRWSYGKVTAINAGIYSVAGLTLPGESTFTTVFCNEDFTSYEIQVVQEERVRGRVLGSSSGI